MYAAPRFRFLSAILAAMAVTVSCSNAEPLPCEEPMFLVDTEDIATHRMICAAASESRHALATCGLAQMEPIVVETVASLIHPMGQCLASFDCNLGRIRIIEPLALREHLPPGDPYAVLPDKVVFRSLLTHELAHAFVHQKLGDREIPLVDHEYIANALELAALPPHHRNTLMDAAGIKPPISMDVIDIFIYGFAPRNFATASYLFFEAHGCETITGILDGSASFRIKR